MEEKKRQENQKSNTYSKSESYQTKQSKQKKCSTLVNRRNRAILLAILSSIILAGTGYKLISYLQAENHPLHNIEESKVPLRILAEEEEYLSLKNNITHSSDLDFEEEINIIQQLTRHKNLQTKKIRELKEELEESQMRIVQLKTDILIKGGEKEQYYQNQIDDFNKQLSHIEDQKSHLLAEVATRDKLIDSKRHELEHLSKVFTDTHDKLLRELSDREFKIKEETQKSEEIFTYLKEELELTNQEISKPEDVRQTLVETKRKITELEGIIVQSANSSLEANEQTEKLAQDLLKRKQQLDEADLTIKNLITKLEAEKATSNDSTTNSGLIEMEEFYEIKIEQIAKTNQMLEEQLEEAEEYLKLTETNKSSNNEAYNLISEELEEEHTKRHQLEQELVQLRGDFQVTTENHSHYGLKSENESYAVKRLKEKVQELQSFYDEEKNRTVELESQFEAMARLTTTLQEEISAHESSIDSTIAKSTPSKLRAKIAYLTTRLAQEKSKSMNSEEKLQELMYSMEEVKERNDDLEKKIHYR